MNILAFDQASTIAGWAYFVDGEYVDSGVIKKDSAIPIETRLVEMGLSLCAKIKELHPDLVVLEDVQSQNNVKMVIDLARLQGCVLLYCASKKIRSEIMRPTVWRGTLHYRQGKGVKRDELKKQSKDYVKEHFGFDKFSEDRCEAICIGAAAQIVYGEKGE